MSESKKLRLWKIKITILLLIFLPSLTNYFFENFDSIIMPGLTSWQLLYLIIVFLTVLLISGKTILMFSISTVSLLSCSIVFTGALIAFLKFVLNFSDQKIYEYSPHYISLLINLLTVVPISIAIISTIPLREYEIILLNKMRGVSSFEKFLLIIARVFNHVVFSVIPNILQVRREEKRKKGYISVEDLANEIVVSKFEKVQRWLIKLISEFLNIGVSSICCSLEYIPLWVLEVSHLPSKKVYKEVQGV